MLIRKRSLQNLSLYNTVFLFILQGQILQICCQIMIILAVIILLIIISILIITGIDFTGDLEREKSSPTK